MDQNSRVKRYLNNPKKKSSLIARKQKLGLVTAVKVNASPPRSQSSSSQDASANQSRHDTPSASDEEPALSKFSVVFDEDGDLILPTQTPIIRKTDESRLADLQQRNEQQVAKWSGGIVQKRQAEQTEARIQAERNYPMNRHGPDKSYDEKLRNKSRFGDPLAISTETNSQADYENRFNIKPGRLWDGVDRGNGYESKYMRKMI